MDACPPAVPLHIALSAVGRDFLRQDGADLLARWGSHQGFWDCLADAGFDSFGRVAEGAMGTEGTATARGGEAQTGVNFASPDYLALATHPAVLAAAGDAVAAWGMPGAGSPALQGRSAALRALEQRVAAFLDVADATVFPSGWAAGYGAMRALVRPGDHVVIDALAHAGLQEGGRAATAQLHRVPHLSAGAVARRLARIRGEFPRAGILVATEGLFSIDAESPDLAALQSLCRRHRATLLVDVAHDLGATGPGGRGALGAQGMLGEVDLVVGSFAKTFGANGGFVAGNAPGLALALRGFAGSLTYSSALPAAHAAAALAAFAIVDSAEGTARRAALAANAAAVRQALTAAGFTLLGRPGPIVPVVLGPLAQARRLTRAALAAGALVNLIEHPAVSRNACRWRLQVNAAHTPAQIGRLQAAAVAARDAVGSDGGRR